MTAGIVSLSRPQVCALVEDRLDGSGPCQVSESLSPEELAGTSVVPGARFLMAALADGCVRLTARGNLNRKIVETMVDELRWHGWDPEAQHRISKVFNEPDFPAAAYLHAVLRVSGLARRSRDSLLLTRKGRALLPEEAAGCLHATLLRATFTRYNLAYLDRLGAPDIFAAQIGLILYLLGQFATDWRRADALMRSTTLSVEPLRQHPYARAPESAFTSRVLGYLCWFGLLEEERAAANDDWARPYLYRKTSLYDRTLSFRLE